MSERGHGMDNWLRTDEALEAVFSLEMVCDQLPQTRHNVHYWKWIIIALHNAVQGYMVLALQGSDSLNILNKECRQQWIAAYKSRSAVFPPRRLDDFLNLYKKIKKGRKAYEEHTLRGRPLQGTEKAPMLMYVGSKPFKPQGTQTESVKLLNELRNDFIHFLPQGWSLEVSGLPQMVKDCVDIIDFLAFECGNVIWHNSALRAKTEQLVRQINNLLDKMFVRVHSSSK